jgi:hypothetical protein
MTTAAVKIRIPESWYGRVHSAEVRGWMQSWFRNPYSLPSDPGASEARISLALPSRAVKVLEGLTGDSPSVALRRLIAAHVPTLPASHYGMPVAVLPEPRQAGFASPAAQGSSLVAGSSVWDAATGRWIPAKASHPMPIPDPVAEAEQTMRFWFWIAISAVALWVFWKYARPSVSAALESAAVAEEMPHFTEWIPKGL